MSDRPGRAELGCAGLLVAVVLALAAAGALTLGRIGDLRTLRYAWVWIGLLLVGGVAPAMALATIARQSRRAVIALTLWMLVALFAAVGLAIN
ncbi:MAG: hypothetical protein ACRYHC_10140, partial [Janthinobacterium lividum]